MISTFSVNKINKENNKIHQNKMFQPTQEEIQNINIKSKTDFPGKKFPLSLNLRLS